MLSMLANNKLQIETFNAVIIVLDFIIKMFRKLDELDEIFSKTLVDIHFILVRKLWAALNSASELEIVEMMKESNDCPLKD